VGNGNKEEMSLANVRGDPRWGFIPAWNGDKEEMSLPSIRGDPYGKCFCHGDEGGELFLDVEFPIAIPSGRRREQMVEGGDVVHRQ
jgi:hypothetical protein